MTMQKCVKTDLQSRLIRYTVLCELRKVAYCEADFLGATLYKLAKDALMRGNVERCKTLQAKARLCLTL